MEFLISVFSRSGFLPHGYCFNWTPGLLWTMVGADALIAAAYFSIPVAILSFVRQRGEPGINRLALLFSAFIFACGITHVMDVWTVWHPDYALHALSKSITAAISIVTAVMLWRLIPEALKVPAVQHLQSTVVSLEAEIARRREAERQVVDIQQSLAVTLASIGAGFVATDRAGKVSRMNAVAERLLGWTQDEARGQSLWQVFDREDRPPQFLAMNPVDVVIEQGTSVETVHRVVAISRDGRRTEVDVQAALTREDDGTIIGLAMVVRDMTQQARAEAESIRLASIVESSNDAIIGKTLDGRITSWNAAAQRMFGYSEEQAIGQHIQMLIPPELKGDEMRILGELSRGHPIPPFVAERLTCTGERLDVSITISPIRDGSGRLIGASKIARDVSEQRRAEAALRASEERLRFTLESAHIGDWDLDLATGKVRHSLRHDRCFGYTELQAEWSFDKFIEHVHPDDCAEVGQTFHVAVTEFRDWRVQCRVIWPDNSVHWISAHGSVQRSGDKATRMLGIVSEITEQRQAENARLKAQRLEAENRQIQEANRLKSQFLANMSHELRTPLNAVIGFADLLHSGFVKPDSPKHQEFLGHIGTSGRHLLQLINDVLDLSKVESGKFDFLPEPIDLPVLLKEVKDILHTAIQRKDISIVTDVDPDLADLKLDPARLKQVLYNYLSNAIKFSTAGGRIHVRVSAQGPDHFRIEVEDPGIGISPADLTRLFTEFQQLDSGYSKQHQGTGLGLALTRRLVEAQGGSVGVRSTLGRGSVFHVVLNRIHGFDTLRSDTAIEDARATEARRVLMIEHHQRDQSRLVAAFSEAGFRVDAAFDGPYALRQARDTAYAALTLDLQLPEQRGLELLGSIRSHGASHASPVIGIAMPGELELAATFAIANVLCKPIRSDEILAAMTRFRRPEVGRANVIVIDDDQTALDLMRATLKSIGIDAVCFNDGRVAIDEIDRHRPDAIILDLMMPEFDGFQVLDALQRLPAWRDVPVFIWTSMLLTDEEYASLARSARAILIKGGGSMEDMLECVRRWRLPEMITHQEGQP
jgi:PAS domain S-box-containing protein